MPSYIDSTGTLILNNEYMKTTEQNTNIEDLTEQLLYQLKRQNDLKEADIKATNKSTHIQQQIIQVQEEQYNLEKHRVEILERLDEKLSGNDKLPPIPLHNLSCENRFMPYRNGEESQLNFDLVAISHEVFKDLNLPIDCRFHLNIELPIEYINIKKLKEEVSRVLKEYNYLRCEE